MSTLHIRFATTNVPESRKRGLLRDRLARARRVTRFYLTKRIDVCATQESGTYLELVDGETPTLKALWAKFNQIVRGRQVGNGVVINTWRFKARLLDDVTVGQGDDAVNIACVLVTERATRGRAPFKFKLYALHKPTRRAINRHLRPVIDRHIIERTRRDDLVGRAWVVAGDFNGPFNHGVELGDHGVDSIRSSRHFEPLGQHVYDRPLLSDHAFLIADALVNLDN